MAEESVCLSLVLKLLCVLTTRGVQVNHTLSFNENALVSSVMVEARGEHLISPVRTTSFPANMIYNIQEKEVANSGLRKCTSEGVT